MKKCYRWILFGILLFFGIFFAPMNKADAHAAIKISKTSIKLAQGKTKKLSIKGTSKKVKWSSNKPKVAAVDNGKITALKGGKAVITAKVGKKRFRCKVTVVGLNATKLTLKKGGTYTLKVKNGKNTKWKSSNKSVATVTSKGKIKAKKTGTAVITCTSNGRKVKCKVYVASISTQTLRVPIGSQYHLTAMNYGSKCIWTTANASIATVNQSGIIVANQVGQTTVTCTTGKAALKCIVKVISPGNITTAMSSLPTSTKVDRQSVTVDSYPSTRTYTVYNQSGSVNQSSKYPKYMPNHGCAACAVTTVLSGYANLKTGPVYTVEGIEKNIFGSAWKANYTKYSSTNSKDKSMPVSLYGISKILTAYHVKNEYVRAFSDTAALWQITEHLKTGNPVVIEVSNKNRSTGKTDKTWANSKHTMVLLGITNSGLAIVADSANRSSFGNTQRVKYATVASLIPYMFSCKNTISTSVYYTSESACGGYILVNPQ